MQSTWQFDYSSEPPDVSPEDHEDVDVCERRFKPKPAITILPTLAALADWPVELLLTQHCIMQTVKERQRVAFAATLGPDDIFSLDSVSKTTVILATPD